MKDAEQPKKMSYRALKVAMAMAIGGGFLVLSGLTLAVTIVAMMVGTPLLVMFSPVLLPNAFAVLLVAFGFVSSGGLAALGMKMLGWAYRYSTWERSTAAESMRGSLVKGRDVEVKDRAQQFSDWCRTEFKMPHSGSRLATNEEGVQVLLRVSYVWG